MDALNNHLERCRCCFKLLTSMQKTVDISKSIEKRFYGLTNMQLIVSEEFSKVICEGCNSKLSEFSDFQGELIENQLGLYEFVKGSIHCIEEEHLVQHEEYELENIENEEANESDIKVDLFHYNLEEIAETNDNPPEVIKVELKSAQKTVTIASHDWHCTLCDVRFKNRLQLRTHMREHKSPEKTNSTSKSKSERKICQLCGLSFATNGFYHHILRAHTEEYKFICDFCGKGYRVKHDMKDHMQTHLSVESRQKFPCSHCNAPFLSKSAMKNHEQIFHSQIVEEHPCDCGKVFESKMKLYQHRSVVHTKGHYPCTECGKVYTQKNVLQKHILRNHVTKTPCEACGKMFAPGMFMKRHLKTHGPPQFKCTVEGCGKEFHSRSALRYHTDSQHKPVESVKCPTCDVSYNSLRNLNRHISRQHSNYRIICEVDGCSHTSARKDYLTAHYRSHKELDEDTRAMFLAKVKNIKVIPW